MNHSHHHNNKINNHEENNSGNHCCHSSGDGGSMSSHSAAKEFLNKFWIITVLLIPLALANKMIAGLFGLEELEIGKFYQLGIASVIFYFSLIFFKHAWHEIKSKKYGMMVLVSLAVGAGYLFSVASTFLPSLEANFYFEIATLIWVLMFGHYLEARSGAAAGSALKEIAKLLPKKAHLLDNGKEREVEVSSLKEGDIVLVKPGEKIPADGETLDGSANVNESVITGESKPIAKKIGGKVIAGSICLDGSLTIKVNRVGDNSTIGQIQTLIAIAQKTKPSSQRLADKAAAALTFIAGITAILTLIIWAFVFGQPLVFALTLSIGVLVIACPHALGLAIPTVTAITTSLATKNGIFIKNLSKLEVIKRANYVVFDKTGTLTTGDFGVTKIFPTSEGYKDEGKLLGKIASVQKHSSHIIGLSIVKYAQEKNFEIFPVSDFRNISGKGVIGKIGSDEYVIGSRVFLKESGVFFQEGDEIYNDILKRGETAVFAAENKKLIGVIAMADEIKKESYEAVKILKQMGVKSAMITGDSQGVAKGVAGELGMETYFAEVLPEDKYKYIKQLQDEGNVVIMIGDGVNDAPAITQADVGVAIGAGTDIAIEAGDVVLIRSNPMDVARLVILSKKVYSKMVQNLFWALGYNIIAIPAAAGAFAAFGFFLRPEIGAFVMSMSTVIVVANALTLKRIKL